MDAPADKIWYAHQVTEETRRPRVLYVDLHLVHEVTSPQAFSELRARGLPVRREKGAATFDHPTPTLPADVGQARDVPKGSRRSRSPRRTRRNSAYNCRLGSEPRHRPRDRPELGATSPHDDRPR
jgi:3-isopropylmalate/(R)-2-methylmalate dehydratase large subunit